jgi:tetratricopeptide (TPR) repeat protein
MKKATKQADSKQTGTKPPAPMDAKEQTGLFAQAMKLFTKGDYAGAKAVFSQAGAGPQISVCESARMYARICEQRLEQAKPELKTSEDYYTYAVAMINGRRFAEALIHLQKALSMGDGPHVRYALALASGLEGDVSGAAVHLQLAVEMDPSLRSFARSDADFQPLLKDPVIAQVLAGER